MRQETVVAALIAIAFINLACAGAAFHAGLTGTAWANLAGCLFCVLVAWAVGS